MTIVNEPVKITEITEHEDGHEAGYKAGYALARILYEGEIQ